MLTELVVRDLGVIDELSLVLGAGMTAVTGETGAGKTLVVGAIDLLTGGRADASLVRPGADEAEIEGRFVHDHGETVVRRVIPREGRSRVYIDGRLATVSGLTEQGADLVDLHGQHAHQSLLKGPVQRGALDRFAGIDTAPLAALIDDLRATGAALEALGGDERARAREFDLLRHQLDEIERAGIDDTAEDERLDAEEDVLADATAHREAAGTAAAAVGGDGDAAAAIAEALSAIAGRAPFTDLEERLRAVAADLGDAAAELRSRIEAIDDDPERLAAIRERRALLHELRRKYGADLAQVMSYRDEVAARLAELKSHDERAAMLEEQRRELTARLEAEQARVRAARLDAAPRLATAVESHLAGLAMAGARMEIAVEGPAGDDVTFRLAANAGHEPLPLAKVASGGELARAMLALRLVLSAGPPTLVFDEVDAGIGGEAANTVGSSLAALADQHQVLVVTHLAQVAAVADHHVAISKTDFGGVTVSAAQLLDRESRVVELSRMLSGSPGSAAARDHALELLGDGPG